MQVAFDSQAFEFQRMGGITRYYFELISRFVENPELKISLFQGFHINELRLDQFRDKYWSYRGCKRMRIPKTGFLFARANRLLWERWIKKIKPQIAHFTYFGPAIAKFPNDGRARKVLTVYDMIHELYPELFRTADRTAERKATAIEAADMIIAISDTTRRDIMDIYNVNPAKIRTIPLANSLKTAPGRSPLLREPYLLYVGERLKYKNFERLWQVYRENPEVNRALKLLCFGGSPFTPNERREFRVAGLEKQLIHLSGSDTDLATAYAFARAMVYPSLYEGFGLPPLEAMRYGCPVIASEAGSIPDVVGDAAVLFDPKDDQSLYSALSAVLSSELRRKHLIKRGIARECLFSWDKCAAATIKTYSDLIA